MARNHKEALQSQKMQAGFCVADFATLSDERRSRSKIFPLFMWMKEPCVRKFEGLARSKLLGILQTNYEELCDEISQSSFLFWNSEFRFFFNLIKNER